MEKKAFNKKYLSFEYFNLGKYGISPFELGIESEIIHHKNKATLAAYEWLLDLYGVPTSLFEIGTKNGGSMVLWDLILNSLEFNTKIVGIDINIVQLSEYAKDYMKEREISVYNCDSGNVIELEKIIENSLENSIDMLIDDGAHTIDTIIPNFKHLWPFIKNNGVYVIEDWSALHPDHRLLLFNELFNYLIGSWTESDTTSEYPFVIHFHRNIIAIQKKQNF